MLIPFNVRICNKLRSFMQLYATTPISAHVVLMQRFSRRPHLDTFAAPMLFGTVLDWQETGTSHTRWRI